MFGRRKTPPPPPSPAPPSGGGHNDDLKLHPGHQAVLRHLAEQEGKEPHIREQLAGRILFDLVCQIVADERGVRIETLLAVLASVGGQECLLPLLEQAPPDATPEQLGLMFVEGKDGETYVFGDPVNRLLVEAPDSLISLAFGAAQALGAAVSVEMIGKELQLVASRVGGDLFEQLDLPETNQVDRPTEWVRVFGSRLREALDLYDVPPLRRAAAFGFAIQRAMDASRGGIDPNVAAQIVLQCAARTSKRLVRGRL